MRSICHLSSVHNRYDPRILKKECISLVRRNYHVHLLVCNGLPNEVYDGVNIIDLGIFKNRFTRMLLANFKMFSPIKKINPELIHFHDLELIPLGLLLKFMGYPIIYDIHEDYTTHINEKLYLKKKLRKPITTIAKWIESLSHKYLHTIIAEKCYAYRFNKGTHILNYPIIDKLKHCRTPRKFRSKHLLFTGNMMEIRGAELMGHLLAYDKDLKITCIGYCPGHLAEKMQMAAGPHKARLTLIGIDEYVHYDRILQYYAKDEWLAGIALFHNSPNHDQKDLTKFYEYMAVGLPIITTKTPYWQEIIEKQGVGYTVDINVPEKIVEKIHSLYNDRSRCRAMSEKGMDLTDEHFNWENEEKKLVDLYDKILNV